MLRFNYVGLSFFIVRYFVLRKTTLLQVYKSNVFLIKCEISYFFICSNYVWKLRYSYVAFWFVILVYIFLRQNYVIDIFVIITYFLIRYDYVFCSTFVLRMEVTLQLLFVFVRHLDVFFIRTRLRYLFGRCCYVS